MSLSRSWIVVCCAFVFGVMTLMTGFLSKSPEFDADSVTRVTRRGHDLTIDPESFVSGSTPAVSTGGVQRHVRVAVMQPWLFNTDVPTDMRLRWSLLPASSADGTMSLSMHYVILHNNLSRHTISTLSSTTLHRVSHEFVQMRGCARIALRLLELSSLGAKSIGHAFLDAT